MFKRFARTFSLAVLGLAGFAALSAPALAQGGNTKYGGSAVPAIVAEKSQPATTEQDSDPLSIPTHRLVTVFLVICGLIYLTYFGLKKYSSWNRSAANKRRSVGVIDTLSLGGKKFVTVTRIYDRILVLGVGEQTITLLTELTEEGLTPAVVPPGKTKTPENFMNLLTSLTRKRRNETRETVTAVPSTTEEEASIL